MNVVSDSKRDRIASRVIYGLEKMKRVAEDEGVPYRTVLKIVGQRRSGGLTDISDARSDSEVVFRPDVQLSIFDDEDNEIGWSYDPDDDALNCSACGGTLYRTGWFTQDPDDPDRMNPTFSFCPFCGRRVSHAQIRERY